MADETKAQGPASGHRYWLRFGDHDIELYHGEVLIGRSQECQLVLQDPSVSRVHARVSLAGSEVAVEDMGSINGVLVNGETVWGRRSVASGDKITIGDQTFELYVTARTLPPAEIPEPDASLKPTKRDQRTATREGLEVLSGGVEKALSLGRGEEAERLLSNWLYAFLHRALVKGEVDRAVAQQAATYAVRIAEATGKGAWLEYVFDLYRVTARPPPAELVERLYEVIRSVKRVDVDVFRRYLAALRSAQNRLGPSERFLLRRLEGLEAFIVSR